LRHTAVASNKMGITAAVHIGGAGEAGAQRLPYGASAHEPTAPRIGTARHFRQAIFAKETHHPVEVVREKG
jgi:hypothetical protein